MSHHFNEHTRIYIDMDGVVADFEAGAAKAKLAPPEFKLQPLAYRHLEWLPGAEKALDYLMAKSDNVWIATKIPSANPLAATEKLQWWMDRRPELVKRVIITPDKGTLGNKHDVLIDDRKHKAHCDKFEGTFIHFGNGEFSSWTAVIQYLEANPGWQKSNAPVFSESPGM